MSALSSLRVRPVAPFCTASTRSVQARRMNVRAHRVGLRHGPAAITIRCRELSGLAGSKILAGSKSQSAGEARPDASRKADGMEWPAIWIEPAGVLAVTGAITIQ